MPCFTFLDYNCIAQLHTNPYANHLHPRILGIVQWLSHVHFFATPWTAACQASLSFTSSQNLLKFMSIVLVMPSNHLILCCPLLLCPHQGLFQWVGFSCQMAKVLELKLHIRPSNQYSRLTSFRIDWFDLLAILGTLKSLLQHHNSKALILRLSAFFMVQRSHLCMTTGKPISFTTWMFVSKVMSLLFNTLSLL